MAIAKFKLATKKKSKFNKEYTYLHPFEMYTCQFFRAQNIISIFGMEIHSSRIFCIELTHGLFL